MSSYQYVYLVGLRFRDNKAIYISRLSGITSALCDAIDGHV